MVKEGYKQTEVGVIPEDWEIAQIKAVIASYYTGGNYKNSDFISPYPLIKMGNIQRGRISVSKIEYINDTAPNEKDRLKYGDVLLNTRNTPELVGKVGIWKNELPVAYFNSNLLKFIFNEDRANPFFINLILNSPEIISEMRNIAKGTTSVAAIYPQDLLKVLIKLPPIREQERIAEALSDIDELISSLEKLIAKKKAIKQGAMQQLLTGKTRLPGFTKEWKKIQISSLGRMVGGGTPSTQNTTWWNGQIPWISSSDLFESDIHKVNMTRFITIEAISNSATVICPPRTVLIVSRVGVGKVAVAPCELCTSQDFTNIIMENHCPEFIAYTIETTMQEKAKKAQGTSIKGVTVDDIAATEIIIPGRLEQEAISNVLMEIDQTIVALDQKLLKMCQIKTSMMQQLLTGKIRLS